MNFHLSLLTHFEKNELIFISYFGRQQAVLPNLPKTSRNRAARNGGTKSSKESGALRRKASALASITASSWPLMKAASL